MHSARQDSVNRMLMFFIWHKSSKPMVHFEKTTLLLKIQKKSLFGSFQGSHRGTQRLPVVSIIQGCSRISNDINRAAAVSSSPGRPYNRQEPPPPHLNHGTPPQLSPAPCRLRCLSSIPSRPCCSSSSSSSTCSSSCSRSLRLSSCCSR